MSASRTVPALRAAVEQLLLVRGEPGNVERAERLVDELGEVALERPRVLRAAGGRERGGVGAERGRARTRRA